jgi:hypothetical protein
MTTKVHRYTVRTWCVVDMTRSRLTDVAVLVFLGVYLLGTYVTIRQFGLDPVLITGAVIIGLLSVLMLYGHRIQHIQIGERIDIQFETRHDRRTGQTDSNGGEK